MNTKRYVLIGGLLGVVFLILLFVVQGSFCYDVAWCRNYWDIINTISTLFFLTPPLLLLSLITYKMKEEIFRAWWNFARWWVPVIIVVTLLLENAGGGGTLGMNKDFTAFVLIILYSVLGIVSLVKIVRAYLRTKGK